MNHESIFFVLVDLLLKGAGVVTIAAAGAWILRRSSAANRNAVWSAAFLALLLLPATLAVTPRWLWFPPQEEQSFPQRHAVEALVVDGAQLQEQQTNEPIAAGPLIPGWRSVLVAVWCAGFLIFLTRRLLGSFQLWKLERHSITPPARIVALASETEHEYRLRPLAEVRLTEDRTVPLTWGILRPVIMLPVEAVEWNEELLRIVLRHEYAHIRRRDSLFRLLAQLACALHWPNPLVWSAGRKLRLIQEQAADDLVLQAGVDPTRYADELVATVRRFLRDANGANHALAMAQPSTLETRVNAVLDSTRDRRSLDRSLLLGCIAGIIVTLVTSGAAQVSRSEAVPANSKNEATSGSGRTFAAPSTAEALVEQYLTAVQQQDAQTIRNLIAPAFYRNCSEEELRYIEAAWVQAALHSTTKGETARKVSVKPWQDSRINVRADWRWPVTPAVQIGVSTGSGDTILAAAEIDGRFFLVGPLPPAKSVNDAAVSAHSNGLALSKTNSETTSEASSAAAPTENFGDHPIEINAENTRFEGGVGIAEGMAKLKYKAVTITADTIRYNPKTRTATAIGDVLLTQEDGGRITSPVAPVEYNLETNAMKVSK